MKNIFIIIVLLQFILTGCTSIDPDKIIPQEIQTTRIYQLDVKSVEDQLKIRLSRYYDYELDDDVYSGLYYDQYAFVFANNQLIRVIDYSEMDNIWKEEFNKQENELPYLNHLREIHTRLMAESSYVRTINGSHNGYLAAQDISDGVAAGLMLVLATPIMPIAAYDSLSKKELIVNWDTDIIGHTQDEVSAILGKPVEKRYYDDNKIIGYQQQYFWMPHYVAFVNDRAVWILHKSFELYENKR